MLRWICVLLGKAQHATLLVSLTQLMLLHDAAVGAALAAHHLLPSSAMHLTSLRVNGV